MKFLSLFSAINLPSDPELGQNGDIYFNTASSVYRIKGQGIWVDLLDSNNHIYHTFNNSIVLNASPNTSFSVFPDESFDNSTIFAISASASQFVLGYHQNYPFRTGTQFTIVRGGEGNISIIPQNASVTINSPSNIYLTKKWDSLTVTNIGEDNWVLQGEFRDLY